MTTLDLGALGFDRGAHLLIGRALKQLPAGEALAVRGVDRSLRLDLEVWCRAEGHRFKPASDPALAGSVRPGSADGDRWQSAARIPVSPTSNAPQHWGLAPRGALLEAGSAAFDFALCRKEELWCDDAPRLYAQAVAAQWDPATAIAWNEHRVENDDVERAVVQLMTYLVENETAALLVPARFLGRIHPHFREVMQLLAVQVADEARHIDVFTRRAGQRGAPLGTSTVASQLSLRTLFEEPDFALAAFLLSVMGEGTFLNLLQFIAEHAPDPVTRRICELALQDEARHVAFGISHLRAHATHDPSLRARLIVAAERRHRTLQSTSGLNATVQDALALLAARSFDSDAIGRGFDAVARMAAEMHEGRARRLERLGFSPSEADALSSLHTRNFM